MDEICFSALATRHHDGGWCAAPPVDSCTPAVGREEWHGDRIGPVADPYLWLEEVTGERPLEWVRARNAESLAELTTDERFAELRDGIREVLDSDERIPYVRRRGELLYNFWQAPSTRRPVATHHAGELPHR